MESTVRQETSGSEPRTHSKNGGERMFPETCLSAGMASDLLGWNLWKVTRDSLFPLKNIAALGTKQYLTEVAFRDPACGWRTPCSRPKQLLLRDI